MVDHESQKPSEEASSSQIYVFPRGDSRSSPCQREACLLLCCSRWTRDTQIPMWHLISTESLSNRDPQWPPLATTQSGQQQPKSRTSPQQRWNHMPGPRNISNSLTPEASIPGLKHKQQSRQSASSRSQQPHWSRLWENPCSWITKQGLQNSNHVYVQRLERGFAFMKTMETHGWIK